MMNTFALAALLVLTFQKEAQISIEMDSGSPGEVVSLPLYFIPPRSEKIGRIIIEVKYPSGELIFVKFDPGSSDTDTKTHSGDSNGTVSFEMTAAKSIGEGLLGYLVFRVSKDAQPGNVPVSILRAVSYNDADSEVPMQASGSAVEVVPKGFTPYIGCFFFTH